MVFIQQMDMPHNCIFSSLLLGHINLFENFIKTIFPKNFFPDADLRSKLVENNQKRKKKIFLFVLAILFLLYVSCTLACLMHSIYIIVHE